MRLRLAAFVLPLGIAFALSGCGFQPLYGPQADGKAGPAVEGLSGTSVALIPERSGQLLRQALQDRFERNGAGGARRYELVVFSYGVSSEQLSFQQNSDATRTRLTARATWSLVTLDAQRRTVTSGNARLVDGYNNLENQFFFTDLAGDAAQRRLAQAIADQITLQLATYFNKSADGV
jgi:LPS-assembly lipoprotein